VRYIKAWYDEQYFFIGIVGGGVQLGPLGIAPANRPIVPAPGDYEDGEIGGMIVGKGNRRTRRKPAPVPLCPPQTHMLSGRYPDRRVGNPATNCLSYGTALWWTVITSITAVVSILISTLSVL
jgi:hypothetical protein